MKKKQEAHWKHGQPEGIHPEMSHDPRGLRTKISAESCAQHGSALMPRRLRGASPPIHRTILSRNHRPLTRSTIRT